MTRSSIIKVAERPHHGMSFSLFVIRTLQR